MADNYLENQYEQYQARKAAWERERIKLFDVRTRTALMKAINDVRENAVTVAG